MVDIALYQPDQAANVGTILRMGACLDLPVHVIEPCGFPFSDRALKRAGMDYLDHVKIHRHIYWAAFHQAIRQRRLVLMTTKAPTSLYDHAFQTEDILLFGQESAGVPDAVHKAAHARLRIPMAAAMRSLNVAMSAAMAVGEALRQTRYQGEGRLGRPGERAAGR